MPLSDRDRKVAKGEIVPHHYVGGSAQGCLYRPPTSAPAEHCRMHPDHSIHRPPNEETRTREELAEVRAAGAAKRRARVAAKRAARKTR